MNTLIASVTLAVTILGYPLVRFTNDDTYPAEPLTQVEVVLVTNGEVCELGSLDDYVHCADVD